MRSKNFTLRNFLITLIFVFFPALVGYFLFLPEWNNKQMAWWIYCVMSLVFFGYTLIISWIFIFFKITSVHLFNISLPLALILAFIFISSSWHILIRIALVVLVLVLTYLLNIFVDRFEHRFK